MNNKRNIPWWGAAAALAAALSSCEKVDPPVGSLEFDNSASITVSPAYTAIDSNRQRWFSDTLPTGSSLQWQSGFAFKISFVPQLHPQFAGQTALFNIYRVPEGGGNPILVKRTLGSYAGLPGATVTYLSHSGNLDTVANDGNNFVYDVSNPNSLEPTRYGVRVTVALESGVGGAMLAYGKEGEFTLSEVLPGGVPTRLSLDGGNPETGDNVAGLEGAFDTAGLDRIVVYRYSEILSMDSVGLLFYIVKMRDSLGFSAPFRVGNNLSTDKLMARADSTVIFVDSVSGGNAYFYPYGRFGRIDTVDRAQFPAYFSEFQGNALNSSVVFKRQDTLVQGLGTKWTAIRGIWRPAYAGPTWSPLSDNIKIAGYSAKLVIDESRAGALKRDFQNQKLLCLLTDEVPFDFDTFGDTTFSSGVQIWIATRNLSADFLTAGNFQAPTNILAGLPLRADTLPDALFETAPGQYALNAFGKVAATLTPDYAADCRVSPLARLKSGAMSMRLDAVSRTDAVSVDIAREVTPGSLLGYHEANLDKLAQPQGYLDTVFVYDSKAAIPENTRHAYPSLGWYTPNHFSGSFVFQDGTQRADAAKTFDNLVYRNPFQRLPLNSQEIRKGYKEFILVAYTQGKYFNEPRVFLSTFSTEFKYVWDKVPPMIHWSKAYNPAATTVYAPIAYRDSKNPANNRVTNLSLLGNIFDVTLTALGDVQSNLDPSAGIRDAGLGKISSVTLCFHLSGVPYVSDPVTGLRQYPDGSEIKRFSLPAYQIASQTAFTYGPPGGNEFKISNGLPVAVFSGVDASTWKRGTWDMWMETEDDLGNAGMAPYGQKFNIPVGDYFIRNIEIK